MNVGIKEIESCKLTKLLYTQLTLPYLVINQNTQSTYTMLTHYTNG